MQFKDLCVGATYALRNITGAAMNAARGSTKMLLIMKMVIILLTGALLQVQARGKAQTITLSGQNIPLSTVFAEIKKQTGFLVVSNYQLIQRAKPVTITAKDQPLTDFLKAVLIEQSLDYTIDKKTISIKEKYSDSMAELKSITAVLAPPGDVQGRVTNEEGEPLAGANVTIKGTSNQGASTDINGYYKISTIAAGDYILVVSYIGYATKTAIVSINEKKVLELNFKLTPSLVNLDQLTVTSTLSKRAIRAYPATIAVINQEDLKNRNLNNIANVLEAVPGIIVTPGSELGNSGNTRQPTSLLIRGTSAVAEIKYLVDGVEILSSGLSILQTLDPNEIENIEILKGPMASTLYGSGAAGGIIAITTKNGKQGKTKINFKTMFTQYADDYANYNGYNQNYSASISGGAEQFNYLLGAGYNLYPTTKLSDINNGIDDRTWSYNAKVRGKVNNIAADLSLQYGNEKNGTSSNSISDNKYRASLGFPTYPVGPVDDYRNSQRSFLTSLHLTHTIATNFYQDLTIGYNMANYSSSNYTMNAYDSTYYNYENLSSKINARYFVFYNHAWSADLKTSITAGFEYNGYEIHTTTINSTTPLTSFFTVYTPATANAAFFQKSPFSSTGYFAELVTGFSNNLFLTTGVRYDVNAAYGDNVGAYAQPRVGLSYVIESGKFKIKPRVVWGVSSNPPDPIMKTTSITIDPSYTYISVGNPDIKPQRCQGYEFGADLFYGSNYTFNITYYDQQIKDLISSSTSVDLTTDPVTYSQYYYNIADAVNKGIEVSTKAIIDPFTVDLSYTQTTSKWGKVTGQAQNSTVYPGAPNLAVPKSSFFARLACKIPSLLPWTTKGGRISLDWRYNGSALNYNVISYTIDYQAWQNLPEPKPGEPNPDNYLIRQKGYSYFNLRADYPLANYASLYIDIQNLLDKQGSINGQLDSRFPGRRINFGFNINL